MSTASISNTHLDYFGRTIGRLCEAALASGDDCVKLNVCGTGDGTFGVIVNGRKPLLIDTTRRVFDDPNYLIPADVPGRLSTARGYTVTWQDEDGRARRARVLAPSREFARLYVDASRHANVTPLK